MIPDRRSLSSPCHHPRVSTPKSDVWRRPSPTAEQCCIDLVVGVAAALLAVLNLTLTTSAGSFLLGPPPSWPEQVGWAVAVTLPLAWRRRQPEMCALMVTVAFVGGQMRAAPEVQIASGAIFVALYSLGAWGRDRRRSRRLRVGIIAGIFGWISIAYLGALPSLSPETVPDGAGPIPPILAVIVSNVLVNALFFGFAYYSGELAWTAARREHLLQEQAADLRRSQQKVREQAVVGERVRIARDLHDVVAHHVSVMGLQAAACRRVLERDMAKAKAALAAVEDSARAAVEELRRTLGLLRSGAAGEDAGTAGVGVDRLEDLLAGPRAAGLTVRFGIFGDPVPVPESVSQAVYRVVQEAVTNTLKHARAKTLDVRIRYLASELEVDVVDDGRGGQPSGEGGLGLVGMRERVAAHHGVLEAGPRIGGGFRVRARFPLSLTAAG